MKTFTIPAALLALATLASASPVASKLQSRQFEAVVTFFGAGPNPPSYTLSLPTDGSSVGIDNSLGVSRIFSQGGATCDFKGAEGSDTVIVGAGSADVGPPQPQVEASCLAL